MNEYLKSAASAAVLLAFIGGTMAFEYKSYGNHPWPLEGQREHAADLMATNNRLAEAIEQLGNELKADNVERRIEATCAMLEAARDARATILQQSLRIQFAAYQQQHVALTGREYVIAMCQ